MSQPSRPWALTHTVAPSETDAMAHTSRGQLALRFSAGSMHVHMLELIGPVGIEWSNGPTRYPKAMPPPAGDQSTKTTTRRHETRP